MAVEHIKYTDSLRQGTDKINNVIDHVDQQAANAVATANNAMQTAQSAEQTANQALDNSEATQHQLDTIVIDGDSSVEAAQARVSAPKGITYDVLKDRLDAGEQDFITHKAETVTSVINAVEMFGADPTGAEDSTQALNDAADYAYSLGANTRLYIPKGTYRTTDTVKIKCELDATQATINYYGTGTAMLIGDDTALNIVTPRQIFRLPRVVNKLRDNNGWDGSSVGVKCVNLNTCEVYVPFIQDFENGLVAHGYGGGMAYTTFYLGALWENHKNLVLSVEQGGYTNQNTFIGGRLQHSQTKGATLDDLNASQIYMVSDTGRGPNNNVFVNVSLEGENVAYYRVDMSGVYNMFLNCRWEYVGNPPRIRYRSTAQYNKIIGGYAAQDLIEVFDGELGGGEIDDNVGAYIQSNATEQQVIPNNTWTTLNKWNSGTSRRVAYDSNTGKWTPRPGRWIITATAMFVGNSTGIRQLRIMVNSSVREVASIHPNTSNQLSIKASTIYKFNGQDTFEIQALQASGNDLALNSGIYTKIEAEYLGY